MVKVRSLEHVSYQALIGEFDFLLLVEMIWYSLVVEAFVDKCKSYCPAERTACIDPLSRWRLTLDAPFCCYMQASDGLQVNVFGDRQPHQDTAFQIHACRVTSSTDSRRFRARKQK